MGKHLEYAIIIFMVVLLLILFRWSENGRYNSYSLSDHAMMLDTRSGDIWAIVTVNKITAWRQFPSLHE